MNLARENKGLYPDGQEAYANSQLYTETGYYNKFTIMAKTN